jgi:RND family efflux transporter MFP subunit
VHVGSMVTIHVQATGQQFSGSVIRYTRNVSNSTRTMLAEVDVPNPDLTLTPGMYANVTFALQQKTGALIVPASAIIQGDEPSVMLVDSRDRVLRRPVVLGIASANEQEVTGGLNEGDRVIIGELSTLQPGEKVRPQNASPNLVTYHQQTPKGGE